MATITNTHLAGAPLICSVNVAPRSDAAFHRVKLEVTVSTSGIGDTVFPFSQPVPSSGNSVVMTFDIASAVRAIIDAQEQTAATGGSYLEYAVSVAVTEEWITDGELHTADLGTATASNIFAGRYTDAERLGFATLPAVWSRKPVSSPEVCFTGYPHIVAGQRVPQVEGDPWVSPTVAVVETPAGASATYNTYGITAPANGHELRFINSLGVHENVFISGLPTREVTIATEQYTIARSEQFDSFSRGLAIKQDDYERWQFSSGPLDEDWVSYYIHEVLLARWAWISIGGHYIPCHIIPDDTVVLSSKSQPGMLEVAFTLRLDITGAPA